MSTASVLEEHHGPYTFADLEALSDDGNRYELIDGGLHVTPATTPMHQRAARRLGALLNSVGEAQELETLDSIDVDCGRDTVLRPDAIMLPAKLVEEGPRPMPARLVALVAEVVSPSSVRMDRVLKAQLYADAGIPHYLLIELDEPRATWFGPAGSGAYEVRGAATGDERLVLTEPVAVEIVPSKLLRAWG
jgi:Uma2 family endonuclease